jgi:hypothetical protein
VTACPHRKLAAGRLRRHLPGASDAGTYPAMITLVVIAPGHSPDREPAPFTTAMV